MPTLSPELQFAAQVVVNACRLTPGAGAAGDLWGLTKEDGTRTTEVDFAVQAYQGAVIEAAFPTDAFVAEERSSDLLAHPEGLEAVTRRLVRCVPIATPDLVLDSVRRGEAEPSSRCWFADPVDSTRGLLQDGGSYSIHLAGFWDGAVQVAAMGYPRALGPHSPEAMMAGVLFLAGRGMGAWWAPLDDPDRLSRLRVSSRSIREAVRLRAYSRLQTDQDARDHAMRDRLTEELGTTAAIRSSTTVRYPLLAAGLGDLYIRLVLSGRLNQELYTWDHAAGSLLVEEAGGRVTDMDGKPLDFTAGRVLKANRGLLASNGVVHDEALAAVQRALAANDS